MSEKTLHFSVDFDHLTDIAREEWCSGNMDWTLRMLESAGLDREMANLVLGGTKRMAQDPDDETGCVGILVDDNWQPDGQYCAFRHFVNPVGYEVGTEGILRQGVKFIREARAEIIYVCNCYAKEMHSVEKRSLAKQLRMEYPEQTWKDCDLPYALTRRSYSRSTQIMHDAIDLDIIAEYIDEDFYYPDARFHAASPDTETKEYAVAKPTQPTAMAAMAGDVDAYVKRQLALDEMELPKPGSPIDNENGYITPDGKFYPCEAMEHQWLARLIEDELGIPENSLIKCGISQMNPELKEVYKTEDYSPTRKQESVAIEWALHHQVKLPYWLLPKEE
jgi:hypothetical protein